MKWMFLLVVIGLVLADDHHDHHEETKPKNIMKNKHDDSDDDSSSSSSSSDDDNDDYYYVNPDDMIEQPSTVAPKIATSGVKSVNITITTVSPPLGIFGPDGWFGKPRGTTDAPEVQETKNNPPTTINPILSSSSGEKDDSEEDVPNRPNEWPDLNGKEEMRGNVIDWWDRVLIFLSFPIVFCFIAAHTEMFSGN